MQIAVYTLIISLGSISLLLTSLYLRRRKKQLRIRELYQRKFFLSVKRALRNRDIKSENMRLIEIMIKTVAHDQTVLFVLHMLNKGVYKKAPSPKPMTEEELEYMSPIISYWLLAVSHRKMILGFFLRANISRMLDDANKSKFKDKITQSYPDYFKNGDNLMHA